jgi:hypothetical protein
MLPGADAFALRQFRRLFRQRAHFADIAITPSFADSDISFLSPFRHFRH